MCRLGRRIIKILVGFILAGTVLFSLLQFKVLLEVNVNTIARELESLENKYLFLLSNQIELLSQIQETQVAEVKRELETAKEKSNVDKILNSSVFVRGMLGQGAGTVIKKTNNKMYILTCLHVVEDIVAFNKNGVPFSATVGYSKADNYNQITGMVTYKANIVYYDEAVDLALLSVNYVDEFLQAIQIAEIEPKKGDVVYSVGNPLGLLRTISKGILSAKEDGFYYSDNTTTFGNSGGGLFNKDGELIGVPSNVMAYEAGDEQSVPESGLGLSRDLITIRVFLALTEYES